MKRISALLGSITLGIALTLGLVLGLLAMSAEEASADDGVWAQATSQQIAVDAALSWLRTQQADDGSFGSSEGTTIDVVLALVSANEDPNTWTRNGDSPLDYLETRVITYATTPASASKLALGVIAARSVVERRQQIGVLRALGFQKGMVHFSFLLESSFVALLGIAIGIALGFSLSYNIIDNMRANLPGITYQVPWLNILVVVIIAYGASLLTTYLPARQAANVYPAEALRYE